MSGRLFMTNGYFLRTNTHQIIVKYKPLIINILQEMRAAKREHAPQGSY